eukprot:gene16117-21905_t
MSNQYDPFNDKEQFSSVQTEYVTSVQPTATATNITYPRSDVNNQTPARLAPLNRWGDSICDWPSNLFPSCWCACCCCYGVYIMAQISQKVGYAKFSGVIGAFSIVYIIGIIVSIATGNVNFFTWFPALFAFIFSIILRLQMVKLHNITECGTNNPYCGEFCCAFWCMPCSIAQMARHVYGYSKVFDGDADIDRPSSYSQV